MKQKFRKVLIASTILIGSLVADQSEISSKDSLSSSRIADLSFLLDEAHQNCVPTQRSKVYVGYDSNINLAPSSTGGLSKVGRAGIYHVDYELSSIRVISKHAFNWSLNGYYDGFTKHNKLQYGSVLASGRWAYYANPQLIAGMSVVGLRHWQPKKFDISLETQSTNFTHWGAIINPFLSIFPKENMVLDLSYQYNIENFAKPSDPQDQAFSSRDNHVSAHLECQFSPKWIGGLDGFWMEKKFKDFLAFAVDANGFGTQNTSNVKMREREMGLDVSLSHLFDNSIVPRVTFNHVNSKDKFQGFESHKLNRGILDIGFLYQLSGYEHRTSVGGSYGVQKYKKQNSTSVFTNQGRLTPLEFKLYTVELEDHWQFVKHWSIFEKIAYDRRSSNESASQANRSYTKWVFQVGTAYKF